MMRNDEQSGSGHEVMIRDGGAVAEAVHFSPDVLRDTRTEIALMQDMVRTMLTRGVDYGRVPGTPKDSLWDPGAQMIAAGFSCYFGERRILKLEDDDQRIAVVVETPVISHKTGHIVATGIGAASTLETKYKYRWVYAEEASALGYNEESLKSLKTKKDAKGQTLYRITNPEQSELLNTIVKMASKRSEVDGAQSLPGVASALRQMFDLPAGNGQQRRDNRSAGMKAGQKITGWDGFWGETRRMGLEQADVHRILGSESVNDWLDINHKNLDECLTYLLNHQLDNKSSAHPEDNPLDSGDLFPDSPEKQPDIATAWDECRNLVVSLKINQKGLQAWWDQFSVKVLLDDFKLAQIPDKFTAEQIYKFHTSLTELATQRAKKAQDKKGPIPQSML